MTIFGPELCASDTVATLGEFFVDDQSLHIDGAWNVTNPQVLWTGNAVKGSNRRKPRSRGTRANKIRGDESTYSLNMLIDGRFDVGENAPADNPWIGLQHNLEYLETYVVNPIDSPTTGRIGTYFMPDGTVRQGLVQVRTLIHQGTELDVFTAVLTVVVPGYVLQPVSS